MDADLIYSSLREQGIDTGGVRSTAGSVTGKSVYYLVQRDGDSLISILAGANASLSEEDIYRNRRYFENGRFCLVQTEVPPDVVLAACRTARACGVTTILKAGFLSLPGSGAFKNMWISWFQTKMRSPCSAQRGRWKRKADFFLKQGVQDSDHHPGSRRLLCENRGMGRILPG